MRTELTSPVNPKIKHVVKLRSCSTREETGEMIVEGFRECRRALDNGYRPCAIFHCPELYLKNENEAQLVADAEQAGADVFECSKTAFVKMAYKERPDGLLMTGPHIAKRLADLELLVLIINLWDCIAGKAEIYRSVIFGRRTHQLSR